MTARRDAAPPDRMIALDGMRGFASVLVLLFHYVLMLIRPVEGTGLATLGRALVLSWTAIDCFFVLSGFLIGGILIDQRDSPTLYRVFYRRRLFRIVPVYALLLAVFGAAWLVLDPRRFAWLFEGAMPAWAYLAYVQNFVMASHGNFGGHFLGVTWSLAVEEQFYVLFPVLVRVLPRRALPFVMLLLIVTTPLLRAYVFATHPQKWFPAYMWTPCRWDALAFGVLAAWAIRAERIGPLVSRATPMLWAVMLATGAFLATRSDADRIFSSRFMVELGYTVVDLFYVMLLLLLVLRPASVLARIFAARPLVWLGTISYALYLFHQAVLGVLHGAVRGLPPILLDARTGWLTLVSLGISLLLAWASFRVFEEPLLRFGRRTRYAPAPRAGLEGVRAAGPAA